MKRLSALIGMAVGLAGCSDAFIEPKPVEQTNIDNRLTLTGTVCTDRPRPDGFPVKVVLVVDQSGSMCVSDPPGSQEVGGFCQQIASRVVPPGVTEPARVRALKRLLAQFSTQSNVSVSLVPFETNVKNPYPASTGSGTSRFTRADNPGLLTALQNLQSQLGKGTDYQGALSYAYSVIADDINLVNQSNPELLPRTRYVVVFLTDGTPYPRCAGNDMLTTYASPDSPELLWQDSSGSGDFCNQIDPEPCMPGDNSCVVGFVKGTDRNQNYQLFSYVDQLMQLRDAYNIGDIRLHTVLLFSEAAVRACGPICQDIYGTYPGIAPVDYPPAAKKIATWTLQQLAQRGNGVYQEFVNGDIQSLGLGALDYSSLASKNVMKQLLVKSMSSAPGDEDRMVDTDADGLIDELDQAYKYKTNNFFADTDGDCFDDDFEVRHYDEGFRPDAKDGRGCDPMSPLTPGCTCADNDGDGLSYQVELYLKTKDTLMDTDGDAIPDGLEVRYGLDPLKRTANGLDTDGDGLPDSLEIRSESNPIKRDNVFFDKEGYQYETKAIEQPDKSICYEFAVSNLKLVTPPKQAGLTQGHNLFKVYFAQAPESGVATDYGVWSVGCAWAQYDPPSVRVPAAPNLNFVNTNFRPPRMLSSPAQYRGGCIGTAP
ncbi:MAG: mtsD [Myxococcaceae bacterium]|nr:mtsD [Myxococcaceae bacterium]